jgi:exopolysaccharide biosynthesis protein
MMIGRTRASLWIGTLPLTLALAACTSTESARSALPMNWTLVDSLNAELPPSVRVYVGQNDELPLRAWYVAIDEPHPIIITRVAVSDDPADGLETVSSLARDLRACVAVNGGYFAIDNARARHVGLLVSGGDKLGSATRSVLWDSLRYETARAAIGFTSDDAIEITWATSRGDTIYTWETPPPHSRGQPAEPLLHDRAEVWRVRDALAAGPALVVRGEARVMADQEAFFGSYLRDYHPRTAAGRTADGALILMVVDGRQPESRGVTLEELATLTAESGAVEALNLDGGGSSTLVVNGALVNRPAGGTAERQVMSALLTFCE